MKKRTIIVKKKLSRKEFEAVGAAVYSCLQSLFVEMEIVSVDDLDMQRLLMAALKEIADKIRNEGNVFTDRYTLTFTPVQAFAMRAVFAGKLDFSDASGAWLLQLCNDIDQQFATSIYYAQNQLTNENNTPAAVRGDRPGYSTGTI